MNRRKGEVNRRKEGGDSNIIIINDIFLKEEKEVKKKVL